MATVGEPSETHPTLDGRPVMIGDQLIAVHPDDYDDNGDAIEVTFRVGSMFWDAGKDVVHVDGRPTWPNGPRGWTVAPVDAEDGDLPYEWPLSECRRGGSVSGDDPMNLTLHEARCFAVRITANHLADRDATSDWADWELTPELSDESYRLVLIELARIAGDMLTSAELLDTAYGVDSRALVERAS